MTGFLCVYLCDWSSVAERLLWTEQMRQDRMSHFLSQPLVSIFTPITVELFRLSL